MYLKFNNIADKNSSTFTNPSDEANEDQHKRSPSMHPPLYGLPSRLVIGVIVIVGDGDETKTTTQKKRPKKIHTWVCSFKSLFAAHHQAPLRHELVRFTAPFTFGIVFVVLVDGISFFLWYFQSAEKSKPCRSSPLRPVGKRSSVSSCSSAPGSVVVRSGAVSRSSR